MSGMRHRRGCSEGDRRATFKEAAERCSSQLRHRRGSRVDNSRAAFKEAAKSCLGGIGNWGRQVGRARAVIHIGCGTLLLRIGAPLRSRSSWQSQRRHSERLRNMCRAGQMEGDTISTLPIKTCTALKKAPKNGAVPSCSVYLSDWLSGRRRRRSTLKEGAEGLMPT